MLSNNGGQLSRSSPAALSTAARPSSTIFDDMNIAQGLLNELKDPRHRSPLNSIHFASLDGSDQLQNSLVRIGAHTEGRSRRAMRTSNTWTSSSGDVLSDQYEVDDRTVFIQEYNRLARKHAIRPLNPEDLDPSADDLNASAKIGSWFSRKILRKTSSSQSVNSKYERQVKHRRSISDLSLRIKAKKDKLKDKDLRELVRLCGSSLLYLPTEYAAGSLSVPTCFRATAQFLVQHAPSTRGVFRVPGSQNVVAALYNHYGSMDEDGQVVSGTVRCPTLPDHIRCDVHDVASAFKKFLSGLPGGILGTLHLFNSLISIHTQLRGDPEFTRTKQSKVRARLIALAIATLRSQFRRELICAVFGLLSIIGRAAETAPREDERGRPLPTSDLMGYGPLGIIFGPLLIGDLLEDHTMRVANPQGGLVLLPISPPKSRKERHKKSKSGEEGTAFNTHVDKIKVANSIAEMLITHWRDVVRHMKNLSALKVVDTAQSMAIRGSRKPMLRPSASESFALRKPPDWDHFKSPIRRQERSASPTPAQRITSHRDNHVGHLSPHGEMLVVKKQRSKAHPIPNHRHSIGRSLSILAPTAEENIRDGHDEPGGRAPSAKKTQKASALLHGSDASSSSTPSISKPETEGIYSPSTSSDDEKFHSEMISFLGRRDQPDLELMLKENKHPRSVLSTGALTESPKSSEPIEKHSTQPLHFMSTPAFSRNSPKGSPGKSSRKKFRISKDSSGSDKSKPAAKLDTPRKLHKKSPVFAQKRKSDRLEHSKEVDLKADTLKSASMNSDVAAYTMEIEDYFSRGEAYFTKQDEAVRERDKAMLEIESAQRERRYNADRKLTPTRKLLQESSSLSPKIRSLDPTTRDNAKAETDHAGDFDAQMTALKDELEVLKIAKESFCEQGDGKPHQAHESSLDAQWATYMSRWNAIKSDMDTPPIHTSPQLTINPPVIHDQVLTRVKNGNVDSRPSLPFQSHLIEGFDHSEKGTLNDGSRNHPFVKDPLDDGQAGISVSVNESKSAAAEVKGLFAASTSKCLLPFEHLSNQSSGEKKRFLRTRNNTEPQWKQETIPEISKARDVGAEYRAFMADSNALTARWDETHAKIYEPDFKAKREALVAEIAILDSRWAPIQAAIDAEKGAKVARDSSAKKYSSPFKDLVKNGESVSLVPAPGKPKIKIFRPSSKEEVDNSSKFLRRFGGSDPGLQPRIHNHSPRRVSRSLYDHPKRINNLLAISKQPRDPLSRVSREDDAASLVVLAQAMNAGAENTDDRGEKSPNQDDFSRGSQATGKSIKPSNLSPAVKKIGSEQTPAIPQSSQKDRVIHDGVYRTPQQDKKISEAGKSFSSETAAGPMPSQELRTKRDLLPSLPKVNFSQQPATPVRPSNTPSSRDKDQDTERPYKSSRSPSKISALVARFNNDGRQSPPLLPPPSTTSSPAKSNLQTPTKAMVAAIGTGIETASNSIVAPYTTNPSSPTWSPKAGKASQLVRPVAAGEFLSVSNPKYSPVRKPTPKRILRESLEDSTPLRSIAKTSGAKKPTTTPSPQKIDNPDVVALRPVQERIDGSPARNSSKLVAPIHELDGAPHEKPKASMSPKTCDTPFMFTAPSSEDTSTTKTEADSAEEAMAESFRRPGDPVRSSSSTDHLSVYFHGVHLKPAAPFHSEEMRSSLPAFDGPTGASNIGRVLPRADPIPVAQHLKLARPSTESTALNDYPEFRDFGTHAVTVSGPPPGRSSSLLYNQVRILQRQLAEKVEEIQHLRHQLSTREDLDVGTLSEELRETKRDLQSYKTRAEVAEKQLEIVMRMPSRSNSLKHPPSNSSRRSDEFHRSSIEWKKEDGTMSERIRKALHGLDGTESMQRWSSGESTDTVIRDIEGVVIAGSEYSNWMEQATIGESTKERSKR